jgi:CHAT domain-containing protein
LPGTRREVAAIAGLFPPGGVTTILGDQARESTVQAMARSGKLKGFRFLHLAAHGRDDPHSAYRTALILAPDPEKSDDPEAFDSDGEITAEQIARTWDLDADLVVLSACESGLGRAAGGEGLLGFAQPLLARGARSLVLSLWKVDDDATALLMTRFYQNLLGKRAGLAGPMPKAEALAEAKAWLRGLSTDQADRERQDLKRGLEEEDRPEPKAVAPPPGGRPFEHPNFWSAFVLVGSPD